MVISQGSTHAPKATHDLRRNARSDPIDWCKPFFARWAPLIVVVALAVGAAVGKVHSHVALGIFVVLVGLGAFWVAARMNQHQLENERYSRGPGWWLGLLISKTNVPIARAAYILMGIGICTLSILSIAS